MLKLLKRFFSLSIIIFVFCLILITGVAYLTLSEGPLQQTCSYDFNTMRAVPSLNSKFNTESIFFFSNTSNSLRTLTVTKDELNAAFMLYTGSSIIASFFNTEREKQYDSLKLNYGSFSNGEFTLFMTQKIPYKIPFESYLNINIKAVPQVKNNRLFIEVIAFKAGRLKIPALILNFILKLENNKINNLDEVRILVNAIKELKTQNDGIYLVYYPVKLSEFLSSDFINSFK